jgi:hypothetical protein
MTMRALTDKEIELAASHAAEYTRTTGAHQQAMTAMRERHIAEVKALRAADGLSDDVAMPVDAEEMDGDVRPASLLTAILPMALPFLASFLRRPGAQPFPMGSTAHPGPADQTPDPDLFAGKVTPPTDAPPGVPIDLATGRPIVIPAPPSAPLPGTGTHPGCTVANPCAKHGGTGAPVVDVGAPAAPPIPDPSVDVPTQHYDGRPRTDATKVCTVYKPCAECVERSRRPVITVTTRTGA